MLILGIIIGILVSILIEIIAFMILKNNVHKVERFIKQNQNKFTEKGEVFYDTDSKEEMDSFISSLKEE